MPPLETQRTWPRLLTLVRCPIEAPTLVGASGPSMARVFVGSEVTDVQWSF